MKTNPFNYPWSDFFKNNEFLKNVLKEDFPKFMLDTVPSTNLTEDKTSYQLDMAAPGLKKQDFKIDVEANIMTISAEAKSESKKETETGYTRREYDFSTFSRSFTLPDKAAVDKITATYTDGVLTVKIPKRTEEKTNGTKINVE